MNDLTTVWKAVRIIAQLSCVLCVIINAVQMKSEAEWYRPIYVIRIIVAILTGIVIFVMQKYCIPSTMQVFALCVFIFSNAMSTASAMIRND